MEIKTQSLSKLFLFILFTLSLIPSLTFSIIPAEIFPWAFLLSILYIKKYNYYFFYFIIFLIISSLFGILKTNGIFLSETIRSLAAYFNPLFVFLFMLNTEEKNILDFYKISKKLFYFLILLGIIQYSGLLDFLTPVIRIFIPRGSMAALNNIRGVTLLSTEPSRASYELFFIYLIIRNLFLKTSKNKFFFDIFILLYFVVIIKSATGLFLLFIFFLIFYGLKFIIFIFFSALLFLNLNLNFNVENRALSIIQNFFSENSLKEVFDLLVSASGFRIVSILSSFKYSFYNIFGGGIGNWLQTSLKALNNTQFSPTNLAYFIYQGGGNWVPVRPTSFLASLALDTGVIGIFLFILMFLYELQRYLMYEEEKKTILFFLIYLTLFGAVGNPVPWICITLILRVKKIRKEKYLEV
jgi:hypothetical protein